MTEKLRPPKDAEYREWYERGWRYSSTPTANLDHVPNNISPFSKAYDDWLDGYLDRSTGREKWHLFYCESHRNDEGGCGRA